jgi:hypothetical protein
MFVQIDIYLTERETEKGEIIASRLKYATKDDGD